MSKLKWPKKPRLFPAPAHGTKHKDKYSRASSQQVPFERSQFDQLADENTRQRCFAAEHQVPVYRAPSQTRCVLACGNSHAALCINRTLNGALAKWLSLFSLSYILSGSGMTQTPRPHKYACGCSCLFMGKLFISYSLRKEAKM